MDKKKSEERARALHEYTRKREEKKERAGLNGSERASPEAPAPSSALPSFMSLPRFAKKANNALSPKAQRRESQTSQSSSSISGSTSLTSNSTSRDSDEGGHILNRMISPRINPEASAGQKPRISILQDDKPQRLGSRDSKSTQQRARDTGKESLKRKRVETEGQSDQQQPNRGRPHPIFGYDDDDEGDDDLNLLEDPRFNPRLRNQQTPRTSIEKSKQKRPKTHKR